MPTDALDDRRKALEEEFFKRQNEQLVKKLREQAKHAQTKDEIHALTGISNDAVLDALAKLNLGPAATLMMSVLPLVEVAWADGKVDDREHDIVLQQANNLGITKGGEAALLLAQWLDEKPDLSFTELWTDYIKELCRHLKPDDRELLKNEVLGRARMVAESSGALLGLGFSVSKTEKAVLDRLAKAFK